MSLPIRTTISDVEAVCNYLSTKPTGATLIEARAVLDANVLDSRKLVAMRYWGLIEQDETKIRLTDAGRRFAKDKFAKKAEVSRSVVARIPPYKAIVERAVHKGDMSMSATEVGAHWHQHFSSEASDSNKILNDQAVCFFQIAQAADLGTLVIGRKGQQTRFEFHDQNARQFVEMDAPNISSESNHIDSVEAGTPPFSTDRANSELEPQNASGSLNRKLENNRVFITHGKNIKILDQVKKIVSYGKLEPIVAQERETAAKPVPDKVMDEMRRCGAAVIHVGSEGVLTDSDGNHFPKINGNVLIEIGAAMALFKRNFILLVENGVKLPSNLQGFYECRYTGNELSGEATMKLLEGINDFKLQR